MLYAAIRFLHYFDVDGRYYCWLFRCAAFLLSFSSMFRWYFMPLMMPLLFIIAATARCPIAHRHHHVTAASPPSSLNITTRLHYALASPPSITFIIFNISYADDILMLMPSRRLRYFYADIYYADAVLMPLILFSLFIFDADGYFAFFDYWLFSPCYAARGVTIFAWYFRLRFLFIFFLSYAFLSYFRFSLPACFFRAAALVAAAVAAATTPAARCRHATCCAITLLSLMPCHAAPCHAMRDISCLLPRYAAIRALRWCRHAVRWCFVIDDADSAMLPLSPSPAYRPTPLFAATPIVVRRHCLLMLWLQRLRHDAIKIAWCAALRQRYAAARHYYDADDAARRWWCYV